MKILKPTILSFAILASTITPTISHAQSTDETKTKIDPSVSTQIASTSKNTTQNITMRDNALLTTEDKLGFSYDFSGMYGYGRTLPSIRELTTEKKSDIYVTLVQWGDWREQPVNMSYQLKNVHSGKTTDAIPVKGAYTNQNHTIGWSNVLPGTYRLIITNNSEVTASGNGFVRAYEK